MLGRKDKDKKENDNIRTPEIDLSNVGIEPEENTDTEYTEGVPAQEGEVIEDDFVQDVIPAEEEPQEETSFEITDEIEPSTEPGAENAEEEGIEENLPMVPEPTKEEIKATVYSSIDDVDPELLTDSGSGEVTSRKAEKDSVGDFVPNKVEPVKLNLSADEEARPSRKPSKKALVYVIAAVVTVILIVGFLVFTEAGFKDNLVSPLTIKDKSIGADEFSFMYHYILIENGVDIFSSDTEKMLDEPSDDVNFPTNRDYFLDLTAKEMQIMTLLYDDAVEHDLHVEDKHYSMARAYLDWLNEKAKVIDVTLDTYIKGIFGDQVTEQLVLDTLSRKFFTEDYSSNAKLVELQASPEQADAAYNANKNSYDLVSYKLFRMTYEQRDDAFTATAMIHAEKIVEAMGHDPSQLEIAASEYYTGDAKKALLEKPDATLSKDVRYTDIEHKEFRDFLFEEGRTPGDTKIFTDEDGFPIILCFVERKPQSTPLRSVKIIEVSSFEGDENGQGGFSLGDAQVLSQEIYDYIKDDVTMQSVENYYTDEVLSGKISTTLSHDTFPGKFSDELDSWIFSKDRKPGDKEILQSENGFYVLYFISESQNPEWYDRVNSFIRMNNYDAFLNEQMSEYTYEFNPKGLEQIKDVP